MGKFVSEATGGALPHINIFADGTIFECNDDCMYIYHKGNNAAYLLDSMTAVHADKFIDWISGPYKKVRFRAPQSGLWSEWFYYVNGEKFSDITVRSTSKDDGFDYQILPLSDTHVIFVRCSPASGRVVLKTQEVLAVDDVGHITYDEIAKIFGKDFVIV